MTDNNELKGLGGWLILVGIGVVINPFRLLYILITAYLPIFENGSWDTLANLTSNTHSLYWTLLIIGETLFNIIIFCASLALIYLFFSRHYLFPKLYMLVLLTSLIFIPLDAWLVTKIFPERSMFDPATLKDFIKASIGCLIWVPYMLVSKRVKATFVEYLPVKPLQRSPDELELFPSDK